MNLQAESLSFSTYICVNFYGTVSTEVFGNSTTGIQINGAFLALVSTTINVHHSLHLSAVLHRQEHLASV